MVEMVSSQLTPRQQERSSFGSVSAVCRVFKDFQPPPRVQCMDSLMQDLFNEEFWFDNVEKH